MILSYSPCFMYLFPIAHTMLEDPIENVSAY
jgi:hypothetical protein